MKILIGIDGSPCSEAAVAAVSRRPWPEPSRLLVLGVAHTAIPESFDPMLLTTSAHLMALDTERKRLQAALAKAVSEIRTAQPQLEVGTEVIDGAPRRVIPARAEEWGADLVIVGCHGHGVARRLLLGSVSHAVSLHAPCSVEIARAEHPGGRDATAQGHALRSAGRAPESVRILLANDGSPCSQAAVKALCERPWPPRTSVVLLGVAHTGNPGSSDSTLLPSSAHQVAQAAERERLRQVLARAEGVVRSAHPGLEVAVEVLDGNPAEVIVRRAEEWPADLVMVGCHGHRTARRLLLGSVSHSVGLHAPCSVQIVRGAHGSRRARDAA